MDGRLQAARCDQKNEQADGGDGEGDVCDETQMRRGDAAHGGDEHQHEDEDVEEFFEDDGAEDGGGRGAEIAGVGEDAHDVADAERQDVVGGERGHEDAGADEEMSSDGAPAAGHHLGPANAAQGVAGESEAEDTEDPCGMGDAQGEDLSKEIPRKVYQRKKALMSRPGMVFRRLRLLPAVVVAVMRGTSP